MFTIECMNYSMLLSSIALLLLFSSCQNSYQQNAPVISNQSPVIGVSNDVFQVTAQEYEKYFESRYGLLYQKFNDRAFTGRILTIEQGAGGDYMSSDESWTKGKKNGLSARWFSNGMKMYERNYSEGRWHGTVTRWWPNGQKMYVRAYTNGTRHGKEATWRSDGSPINTAIQPSIPRERKIPKIQNSTQNRGDSNSEVLPSVVLPSPTENEAFPSFPSNEPDTSSDLNPTLPQTSEENTFSVPADQGLPVFPESPSGGDDLPALPGLPDAGVDDLPAFPDSPIGNDNLPALPGLPDGGGDDLPAFPESPSGGDDLPALPGFPESGGGDLPPLPGFPDDAGAGLPPLPGTESSGGGLPPLPSFPE